MIKYETKSGPFVLFLTVNKCTATYSYTPHQHPFCAPFFFCRCSAGDPARHKAEGPCLGWRPWAGISGFLGGDHFEGVYGKAWGGGGGHWVGGILIEEISLLAFRFFLEKMKEEKKDGIFPKSGNVTDGKITVTRTYSRYIIRYTWYVLRYYSSSFLFLFL